MKSRPPVKIAVIAKPSAPDALKQLRDAVAELRSSGHTVRARMTFEDNDAFRFARSAARAGVDLIIAAGGDGTINQVVNGMTRAGVPHPRLAVVPLGTANDFAKGLSLPQDVKAAVSLAVLGNSVPVDVAAVNNRAFINVSTGGFGPDITEESSTKLKRRFGKLAYLFTAVRKLTQLEPFHASFEADGRTVYDGPFFFFAVGNARHTGGGTPVTPHADFSDAQLDLALFTGEKRRDFLTLLPDLRAGQHAHEADVLYLKAGEIHVRCKDEIAVNADGEPLRGHDFHYRLIGQQIEVMRP
ncbi:MAG TPA: YegS/Rv2252/BmrU family lipid kinase [Longimicrobiales bacterium]